jgi:glycosyltransferase involved in cell wall biosynthesis
MGPAQGLEIVLEVASLLRRQSGLRFLLVGEGILFSRLKAQVRDRGLENVLILPHQPYALVPQIYAASDFCLVPLAAHSGSEAVPSKVYRIMACARPVLACADQDSDLAELVELAQCGKVVPPGSPERFADAVSEALRSPAECIAMGLAGRAHVVAHYSRESVSGRYEALVRELAGRRRRELMNASV